MKIFTNSIVCISLLIMYLNPGSIGAQAAVSFTNSNHLISGSNNSGVALAVADMNADGKDDIIRLSSARSLNIHYQNAPNAAFTAYNHGLVSNSFQWGMCIADVDHNGFNDVFSGGAYDGLRIVMNNNGVDSYTRELVPNSTIFLQGVSFADIDNDGWTDVFACHDDGVSRVFQNDQAGNLIYAPSLLNPVTNPVSDNSGNYANVWTDYDNDGDLDLYISKCRIGVNNATDPRRINMLWQNDGAGNFTEAAAAANLKISGQTWTTDFGDIDNDGDMDALVINHFEDPMLMINNGDGTFKENTKKRGLLPTLEPQNYFGIQVLFRDFDNDGFLDILATGGSSHFIFYNDGDGTFTNAPNPFDSNDMLSMAVGDLNHDGFVDIYSSYANAFNSPSGIDDVLWMNDGNSNNHFAVGLQGTSSNINGIGARVELHGSWGMQIREVRAGVGYGIMNSMTQYFGIGTSTSIESLIIKWPSGIIDRVNYPTINNCLMVTEGEHCINCGPCVDDVVTTANITRDTSAAIGIMTDGVVTAGNAIVYNAGSFVLMQENFEVKSNAIFHAYIESCN